MEWWGTEEKPEKRLRVEAAVMRSKFPEGQWVKISTAKSSGWPKPNFWIFVRECKLTKTDGRLRWKMRFQFWKDDKNWQFQNSRNEYTFTLTYPGGEDYPAYPPRARITTSFEGSPPHHLRSDEPDITVACTFDPSAGRRYGWDPSKDTAAVMASWVIEWLLAYRVWRKTGDWPGESAD